MNTEMSLEIETFGELLGTGRERTVVVRFAVRVCGRDGAGGGVGVGGLEGPGGLWVGDADGAVHRGRGVEGREYGWWLGGLVGWLAGWGMVDGRLGRLGGLEWRAKYEERG